MPLIPNYIARFRTHSQSTAVTSSSQSGSRSDSTAGPPTPGPEFARLVGDLPVVSQTGNTTTDPSLREQIARKIHPDLGALLNENTAADNEAVGPPPPRRRSRSAGYLASKQPEEDLLKEAEDEDVQQTDDQLPTNDRPDVPASTRSPFLSRILSTPILSGVLSTPLTSANTDPESEPGGSGTHWSTFGRRRVRASIGEFGSLHRRGSGSKSSVHSKSSKLRTQRGSAPVTPSTTRAPSQVRTAASINDTPPSQSGSPAGTVSSSSGSKSYSMHSQSVRSKRHPQTYPEPIPDIESSSSKDPHTPAHVLSQATSVSTSVSPFTSIHATMSPEPTRPHLDDSPQTFGRGTPERSGLMQKTLPEFGDVFQPPLTSTTLPPDHHSQRFTREPLWTYPARSRRRSSGTVSFPSLPIYPFGSQSRPRAEDLFQHGNQDRKSAMLGVRVGLGSFLSGGEDGAERRTSADWSATEAVKKGNTDEGETWPATVSREMVMLSLGGVARALPVSTGNGEDVAEMGEVGALKEGVTKNPTLFGSTGEDRRQFLRAARRWITTRSTMPADTSSLMPQQSLSQPPTVTVRESFDPATSSSKSVTHPGQEPRGGGLVPYISVMGPTPSASPRESHMYTASDPGPSGSGGSANDHNTSMSHKRKKDVESEDEAQPNALGTRSILLRRRENSTRTSDGSHAPSSFRHTKRIRLSTPSHSSPHDNLSSPHHSPPESPGSRPPSSLRTLPNSGNSRTLSHSSIPLRAIVSPKPPSVDRGSIYHMRDPVLPPPRRLSTQWTGSARKDEEKGRVFPLQGWAFIIGFLVFPLWWVAAAAPVGWGRARCGVGAQNGKGAWSEEDTVVREVVEYDVAYTWRRRCRLMSLLGLLVYIPLIVLLAVLVPRT